MKKVIVSCIAIISALVLGACSSKTDQVNKLYENGQYQEAVDLLETMDRDEEAEAIYIECNKHLKADYDFLDALEQSLSDRCSKEEDNSDNADILPLVNTELANLEKFKDAEFYDAELKELCDKYLEGLELQKEGCNEKTAADQFAKIEGGRIMREEVVADLYEKYGFCADNPDIIAACVTSLPEHKKTYNAFLEIESDIGQQVTGNTYTVEGVSDNEADVTFMNNTKYSFDGSLECFFLDANNNVVYNYVAYVSGVKPHESYTYRINSGTAAAESFDFLTFEYNIGNLD